MRGSDVAAQARTPSIYKTKQVYAKAAAATTRIAPNGVAVRHVLLGFAVVVPSSEAAVEGAPAELETTFEPPPALAAAEETTGEGAPLRFVGAGAGGGAGAGV